MQYELTFIVKNEEDTGLIKEALEQNKGKLLFENPMGRRNFAYPIKNENGGFYFNYYFASEQKNLAQINKALQAEREILRFLIVKNDENIKEIEERMKRIKDKTVKPFRKEIPAEVLNAEKTELPPIENPEAKTEIKRENPEEKEPVAAKKTVVKTKKSEIKTEAKKVEPKVKETEAKKETKAKKTIVQAPSEETVKASDDKERMKKLEEKLDELLKD